MTGPGIRTFPRSTNVSEHVTRATALFGPVMDTLSFSFTPMAVQSSSCMRTTGSATSTS